MPPLLMLVVLVTAGFAALRVALWGDAWVERERQRVTQTQRDAQQRRAELNEQRLPTNVVGQRRSDFAVPPSTHGRADAQPSDDPANNLKAWQAAPMPTTATRGVAPTVPRHHPRSS
jgi:hypothetical protein